MIKPLNLACGALCSRNVMQPQPSRDLELAKRAHQARDAALSRSAHTSQHTLMTEAHGRSGSYIKSVIFGELRETNCGGCLGWSLFGF